MSDIFKHNSVTNNYTNFPTNSVVHCGNEPRVANSTDDYGDDYENVTDRALLILAIKTELNTTYYYRIICHFNIFTSTDNNSL